MKEYIDKKLKHAHYPYVLAGVVVLLIIATAYGFYYQITSTTSLKNDLNTTNQILGARVTNLEAALATTTLTSQELAQRLAEAQAKSQEFEDNLGDINDTVGTLEKLSKTDKELLQKYSRVYFLSDNYVPMSLDSIDQKYLNDQAKNLNFHASAVSYLERMLNRAERDDITIKIVSAYRSFGEQSSLKNSYLTTYGSGSNQFSADQGYSEHQLGTAVDLVQPDISPSLAISFENAPAYEWLNKNAYKYGFVISYPKNNIYYQYEPWHWRFVGVKLATRLHNDDMNFSEMDQREIDNYLVKIFD